MARRVEFVPYRPKTILNKHKRPDHWFWTRYTAYPYKGCQHRCEFCYCREQKYCPFEDLERLWLRDPGQRERARPAAPGAEPRPGGPGRHRRLPAAERKFGLSRRMLEVCLELGFPVFVLERSPLVLRDLDLLQAIDERARAWLPSASSPRPIRPAMSGCARWRTWPRRSRSASRPWSRSPGPAS